MSLFGVKSALFVAMNSKGKLYGTVSTSAKSFAKVKERLQGGCLLKFGVVFFLSLLEISGKKQNILHRGSLPGPVSSESFSTTSRMAVRGPSCFSFPRL